MRTQARDGDLLVADMNQVETACNMLSQDIGVIVADRVLGIVRAHRR